MGSAATKRLTFAEHAVLSTLERIGNGYGLQVVALADQLAYGIGSRRAGSTEIKPKSVYVLLHRMQDKGLVRSERVSPEPGERGPRRRVYWPTDLGTRTLRACEAFEAAMAEAG